MSEEVEEIKSTTTSAVETATTVVDTAEREGGDDEVVKEEESSATFEPVVKLAEVETKSGEEEEEVVIGLRAKLFVYGETMLDAGTGKKSWKERGIGDIRLLRHRDHRRLRVLMRQEKTMKVIVNHALDPRIVLEPNVGSDRSWVWSAFDFADGELVETVFAVRFADSDVAQTFKTHFLQCQQEMQTLLLTEAAAAAGAAGGEESSGNNNKEAEAAVDEATAALQGLSTKGDEQQEGDAAGGGGDDQTKKDTAE